MPRYFYNYRENELIDRNCTSAEKLHAFSQKKKKKKTSMKNRKNCYSKAKRRTALISRNHLEGKKKQRMWRLKNPRLTFRNKVTVTCALHNCNTTWQSPRRFTRPVAFRRFSALRSVRKVAPPFTTLGHCANLHLQLHFRALLRGRRRCSQPERYLFFSRISVTRGSLADRKINCSKRERKKNNSQREAHSNGKPENVRKAS